MQVEGLLDRGNGQAPVIQYVVEQFERLGYASWAHRIINTASAPICTCFVLFVFYSAVVMNNTSASTWWPECHLRLRT